MKIGLCVDDNSGFSVEEARDLDLGVVRMPISIDGKTFYQNINLDPQEFYNGLIDKDVHTSMPSPADTMKVWDDMLTRYDHIIYEPMSSGLSSTCMAAQGLAEMDEYKGKVTVVDNRRVSVVAKEAIFDAFYLIKQGKTPEEIKNYLEKEALDLKLYIAVDTLKYLLRGGRVTPAGATLGSVFRVKPVLKIEGGKLDAKAKVIGMRNARSSMIKFIQEDRNTTFKDVSDDSLFYAMAYTGDIEQALDYRKQVSLALNVPEEDIILDPLSLSVGVHIGKGALALTMARVLDKSALLASVHKYGYKQ